MDKIPPEIELLSAVGSGLANWSTVEIQLSIVFVYTSDMPPEKARALFDGIISFEIRLGIVDTLMAFEKLDEVEAEMWARLRSKLTKAYKKRHELAHFITMHEGNEAVISPFLTYEKLFNKTNKQLNLRQIRQRAAKFNDLHQSVSWFALMVQWRRKRPGVPLPPTLQGHRLVAPLREQATQILEARKRQPQSPLETDTEDY